MSPKRILVIGASDDIGGTGLQVDQKVIAAHGCDAMSATTALMAWKPQGIDIDETISSPAAFVRKAIDDCFDAGGVEAVKIGNDLLPWNLEQESDLLSRQGFLPSVEIAQIVIDALRQYDTNFVVVDQVPDFTSHISLEPCGAVGVFLKDLLQLTTVLTLSISEAVLLLKMAASSYKKPEIRTLDDLIHLTEALYSHGPEYVLLKGDQLPLTGNLEVPRDDSDRQIVVNFLYDGTDVSLIKTAYTVTNTLRGSRYALASAIASNLALGDAALSATQKACRYVEAAIKKGNGPINYFHSTYTLPFSPGYFIEYLLNREDVEPAWHAHVHHDFVKRIGDGTLPTEKFKDYLIQDYLFLVQFARAKALSAYKANSMEDIAASAEEILYVKREMSLHLDYCAEFGLSKNEVEEQEEHQACTAYTRYVLDIAHSESWFALQIAFAPCLLGYGIIAKRLWDDPETVREQGNPYWKWIENYVGEDYRAAVETGKGVIYHVRIWTKTSTE
ncbi:MAG: hypothetical protein Q9161_005095 [Pseudevernia consocians]